MKLTGIFHLASPVGADNGRDERRTSAPPLTAPPGLAFRSSRRASPKGACPPPLIWGGVGCRIASHGGIDFRRGRKSIPYCLGAFTLPSGGRNGSQFETHFDRNSPQNGGSFSGLCRAKRLLFFRFCDTILILRKRVAPNNR